LAIDDRSRLTIDADWRLAIGTWRVSSTPVESQSAIHLSSRDRWARALRIIGAIAGFALIAFGFATSTWNSARVVVPFGIVAVGGALAYHLLTSIVRCPTCRHRLVNLRIGADDAKRKHFPCRRCGATAWLTEGFYWQDDVNG
jgi:hypothetical protein